MELRKSLVLKMWHHGKLSQAYGIKPEVWGRVGPDPRAELQVDPARGPQAQGLGRPGVFSERDIGNTSLCVALPEQANSHSSDASYHGEQGNNKTLFQWPGNQLEAANVAIIHCCVSSKFILTCSTTTHTS